MAKKVSGTPVLYSARFIASYQLVEAGLLQVELLHGGHSGDFLVLPSLVDCNPVVWEIKLWPSQVFTSGLGSSNPFRLAFAYGAAFTFSHGGKHLDEDIVDHFHDAALHIAVLAKIHHGGWDIQDTDLHTGCVTREARVCNEHGIDAFFPILREPVTVQEAMETVTARRNMAVTVEQVMRLILRCRKET